MKPEQILGRDPQTGSGIAVAVEDGLIARIEPVEIAGDSWLTAGLVDLQVNGFRGLDLNNDAMNAQTVSALAHEMLSTGVTSFAPTVITASRQQLIARLRHIAEACATNPIAELCIPFIHVEGPYISPLDGYRGAHPLAEVRGPSLEEFEDWQSACGNRIGLVTISPHFDGSAAYIRALIARGVLVSIGHTHANTDQVRAAVDAGASLSTHLGNGVAPLLQRHPNPIWSQLAEDRLQAMFITDGFHLGPEVFRAMLRVKSSDRSILVSDLVALAGMTPGVYDSSIGGTVELSADGRLSIRGTEMLAGAAMPLIDCIGRAVAMSGLSLAEILPMANRNPGKLAGNRGQLAVGMRADLLQFRWDKTASKVSAEQVWLAGSLEPVS